MSLVSPQQIVHGKRKKKNMASVVTSNTFHHNTQASNCVDVEPPIKKQKTDPNLLSIDTNSNTVVGFSGKPKVFGEDLVKLKKMLREREKFKKSQPKFKLREAGDAAAISVDAEDRMPLFLCDIQHLLMYSQLGHHSPYSPARWCNLEKFNNVKHTNVLIIENLSLYHYMNHESILTCLKEKFPFKVEMITPGAYKGDVVQDIATVSLSTAKMKKFVDKYGTLEEAVTRSSELYDRIRDLFPVEDDNKSVDKSLPKGDKFPRTHLLLSGWQMVEECYPMPIKGLMEKKFAGYVLSKDSYKDVTPSSPMFGIDCEMCQTCIRESELTRVSVVDEKGNLFYEELVKPDNKIIDYVTRYSGITHKMMVNVTKKLKDVQDDLRRLLPSDAILVGQSLGNDLHALKLMHPYVIDTSVIYNLSGDRQRKTKLQTLAKDFLNEQIQVSSKGHCSVEDSLASLNLVKLKLSKHLYFGDAVMADITSHLKHHTELATPHYATSMLKQCTKLDKTALVVSIEAITKKYNYFTYKDNPPKENPKIKFSSCNSNKRIIRTFCDGMNKSSLNIAHVNFTEEEIEADAKEICNKVNKWVESIHFKMVPPSLCVVIFGGYRESGNGCCFIANKEVVPRNV